MNQTEAAVLVAYLNRAGLLQALEGQAPVWADALDDVNFTDAQTAARTIAKTTARWITPGDIRNGVQTIRRQRLLDMATPIPPESINPDDTATERAWHRAYVTAYAGGASETDADVIACRAVAVTRPAIEAIPRPVLELIAQTAATTRIPRSA